MRVLRLTYISRQQPEVLARVELTPNEARSVVLLARHKRYKPAFDGEPTELPMGIAVEWIAQLGGYTGRKSSGGPPGAIVLSRGLQRLLDMTQAFEVVWQL